MQRWAIKVLIIQHKATPWKKCETLALNPFSTYLLDCFHVGSAFFHSVTLFSLSFWRGSQHTNIFCLFFHQSLSTISYTHVPQNIWKLNQVKPKWNYSCEPDVRITDSYSTFSTSDAEEFLRTQKRDPPALQTQSSPVLGRYFLGFIASSTIILVLGNFSVLQGSQMRIHQLPCFPEFLL